MTSHLRDKRAPFAIKCTRCGGLGPGRAAVPLVTSVLERSLLWSQDCGECRLLPFKAVICTWQNSYVLIWLRKKLMTTLREESVTIKCDSPKKFATLFATCLFPLNSLSGPDHMGPSQRGRCSNGHSWENNKHFMSSCQDIWCLWEPQFPQRKESKAVAAWLAVTIPQKPSSQIQKPSGGSYFCL